MSITAALFLCTAAVAVDGDTIRCGDGVGLVRMAAIDAPEMPGHCRRGRHCAPGNPFVSRDVLTYLLGQLDDKQVWMLHADADPRRKGFQERDRYGRIVAVPFVDGKNLCEVMLRLELARPWP